MGFFRSLKGKVDVGTDNPQTNSEYDEYSTAEEKRRVFGHSSSSTTNDEYSPPPGPPPSHQTHIQSDFAPPPGPPPHFTKRVQENDGDEDTYAPPSGPPPGNPPPYHDWTVIPDTALLPPPPPLPQDYSPTNNASYDSAARAHEWCAQHPVYTPSVPSREIHSLAAAGHLTLERPPAQLVGPNSRNFSLRQQTPTTWSIRTSTSQQDTIIMSSIPLYFAAVDHPSITGRSKTISFEIHVYKITNANSGIAIGYAAKPYPPWRLPGWHRASIGVHGDDGRRFVNDPWGGRDFVEAFRPGETIEVGMRFSTTPIPAPAGSGPGKVKTTAFVTRDGRTNKDWEWEIDEERDERDEGIDGLMGDGDLYPALGVFGGVEFEVRFRQNN
ncbi:hypothetical protein PV08_03279 [Exophiala spinifera]|uniref:SPRY domain-containing protein n=1 Tax=Exophiala spinifera TaxID=91928 RepID=A0A0D2C639_9EURO|nr:uncharacterized protein PV08_03279 [Exophiala spinifera]KIW18989.1 hypothetical protein PV08_03279 [Exophiala spinifera]